MRLAILLVVFIVINGTAAQFMLGQNGLRLPPINLMTVYRILKRGWDMLMNPQKEIEEKESVSRSTSKLDQLSIDRVEDSLDEDKNEYHKNEKLKEILQKLNETCAQDLDNCKNMTAKDLMERANIVIDKEELLQLLQKKSIQADGILSTNELLDPESKTPSFLPAPFNSSGWIMSYVVLNGVLLGLYLLLGIPYFATGRTAAEKIDEYGGYESYGDNDMMMQYMMEDDDEETMYNFRHNDIASSHEEGSSYVSYDGENRRADRMCFEQMLCLKPASAGRALTTSHMAVKLLDWVPGLKNVANRLDRRLGRLDNAVAIGRQGRQLSCEQLLCNKRR